MQVNIMHIERDAKGDFLLESSEVANRFGLPLAELRHLMALGLMTSTVEMGEGEDQGASRLTLRWGSRVWRAIVDANNNVTSEKIST